jgi:hypothetical protein
VSFFHGAGQRFFGRSQVSPASILALRENAKMLFVVPIGFAILGSLPSAGGDYSERFVKMAVT